MRRGRRETRYIRPHDQVIVFLDDCRYERLDSQTKEKTDPGAEVGRRDLARQGRRRAAA